MTGRTSITAAGYAMAVWALAGALTSCQQNRPVAVGAEDAEPVTVSETKLPDNRMVYPWSVVPGGVDSPQAMGQAIQADPVVAAHYAGLRPEAFRAEQFTEKKEGYVSYRIRDKIYWTRRMVTLAAGERVLTDGTTLVRGRCGNLYSPVPREPMAAVEEEPSEKAMEEPVRAAQLTASPEMQAEKPVEIEKFENPKSLAESFTNGGGLPVPQAEDALPPVWVGGGWIGGPGGGVMGMGGFGGVGGGEPGLARHVRSGEHAGRGDGSDIATGDTGDECGDSTAVGADGVDTSAIDTSNRGVSGVSAAGVAESAGCDAAAAAVVVASGGTAAVASAGNRESAAFGACSFGTTASGDTARIAATVRTAAFGATGIGAATLGTTSVRTAAV